MRAFCWVVVSALGWKYELRQRNEETQSAATERFQFSVRAAL